MKVVVKILGGLLGLVALAVGVGFFWARSTASAKLARVVDVHAADFPIPFPLSEAELAALRDERRAAQPRAEQADAGELEDDAQPAAADPLAGVDLDALALERARERGKHLVQALYACAECHGEDFGGGTMIDDAAMGTLLGPNITGGEGSVTVGYTSADWDRIVRHAVKRDGHPAAMPAEDFQSMSDRELSDIVAYVSSRPPVDRHVPPPALGPLGTVLMATGKLPLSADLIGDHHRAHARQPPEAEPTAAFGKHLAGVCAGCHRPGLEGGRVAGGPPDWPPASNLTPHAEGLAGWRYEDFVGALRSGVRPDGTALREPMSQMKPYADQMTDVEMRALWAYLQSVEPRPSGQ